MDGNRRVIRNGPGELVTGRIQKNSGITGSIHRSCTSDNFYKAVGVLRQQVRL